MKFIWDENKRISNLNKHEIDFIVAESVFAGITITMEDNRKEYGEERFITFGHLKGRLMVTIHTEEQNVIRIISMRKANAREKKRYQTYLEEAR